MIEKDTVRLLREVDAGIKMGTESIAQVAPHAQSAELRQILVSCRREHQNLGREVEERLHRFQDRGKEPSPMLSAMSEFMTGLNLAVKDTDDVIASRMTDGCNMGVKSLSRYLNQYAAADEPSKDIAKRLIRMETKLSEDLRGFL